MCRFVLISQGKSDIIINYIYGFAFSQRDKLCEKTSLVLAERNRPCKLNK